MEKKKIKIGYIGLGRRGMGVLRGCISQMDDVEVAYLCDLSQSRLEKGRKILSDNGRPEPILTTNYKDILEDPEVDAVMIMIWWNGRPQMAMDSMRARKYTAIEVGCASTLNECFDLVEVYEETGTPIMMLENCCYGRRELMVLNMVKQGLFGELVHCSGGYLHYLNEVELFANIGKEDIPHYRIAHYRDQNRENYPTHELGPISKVLGINRTNRMVKLSSFASKSVGLKDYAKEKLGEDSEYAKWDYKQGDIVNTVITCAGGETILLTLDTTVPRAYYSRGFCVRGTRGMSYEDGHVVFLEGMEEGIRDNEEEMYKKYDHPIFAELDEGELKGGHGGLDWLTCRAFVESVRLGINTPIDVYDTAAWLAIGPLSEKSISEGGIPVDFPDFTRGKWQNREPAPEYKYALDVVCDKDGKRLV
ncbi:MAG: gfo/Idh/MocA family oxidoreductase [Ruminococcaceae bacterium]|nr:gfo/Idh/MocA family oxidoreductase [Oscillospiraceae bacterium]